MEVSCLQVEFCILRNLVVTLCTTRFSIQKFYVLPTDLILLRVLYECFFLHTLKNPVL